jgi:hypothetical protein
MTFQQIVTMNLVALLLAETLGGLVVRRRARLCRSFAALVAATLTGNLLIQTLPGRFWTWEFWMFKEMLYGALYMATGLELGALLFAGLPRGKRLMFPFLVAVSVAAPLAMHAASDLRNETVAGVIVATMNAAAAWLFALLMLGCLYYRVPLHPFHRGILTGAALHLSVYSALLGIMGIQGEVAQAYFNALDPAVYAAAVSIWMWAAWRPEGAPILSPQLAALLQPWAARA